MIITTDREILELFSNERFCVSPRLFGKTVKCWYCDTISTGKESCPDCLGNMNIGYVFLGILDQEEYYAPPL